MSKAAARQGTAPAAIRKAKTHGGLEVPAKAAQRGTAPASMKPRPVPGTPPAAIRKATPLTAARRGSSPEFKPIWLPEHPI